MKNYVEFLTGNHIINCAFLAWFLAQMLKVIFVLLRHKRLDLSRFVGAGGMPSSHSACVVAMTVATVKVTGFYSPQSAIATVLSLIVMYDATGVRRAAGEQAKILNLLIRQLQEKETFDWKNELKELIGHTPFEVFVGALIGFLIAFFL